jgi:hypothetical protein
MIKSSYELLDMSMLFFKKTIRNHIFFIRTLFMINFKTRHN